MTRTIRVGGIVTVAVFLALAMLAGPAAAAVPTVDSETTNTATTSDWTDGSSVSGFEANSSNTTYLEASFDTKNASVEIADPNTGIVHYSNASMQQTYADSTNNTWHYAANFSNDELATMPMGASEDKSVTVRFINDSEMDNPDTKEITVTLNNTDDRAVVYAGSEAQAGNVADVDASTEQPEGILATVGIKSDSHLVEADNVALGDNATGTTVTVIAANTSGVDVFSQAEEKTFGSYEEGDFLSEHALTLQGHNHAVFKEAAPTEDLADGITYAEVTTVHGHDAYQVHVDEDYSGESSVDVVASANDGYNPASAFLVKRDAFGGSLGALTATLLFAGALGRREV